MAVDLEYNGVCKMGTVLSLIQISTVDKDYIIDALIMRDNTWYAGLEISWRILNMSRFCMEVTLMFSCWRQISIFAA